MASFWVILAAFLVYGAIHSLLATNKTKALFNRWLGTRAGRGYRLGYNFFAVISLLPVFWLFWVLPDQTLYRVPSPWNLINLALQGLALVGLAVGLVQTGLWSFLGFQQLQSSTNNEPMELVIQGLYRRVRHPLYTAGLLFIWASPVMSINLLALYIGMTIYLVVGARFEERKLVREFGEIYVQYQRTTPFLIPRLYNPHT
jgi:protein-S-isoprenylcysteine O-methyltransferase Ste14